MNNSFLHLFIIKITLKFYKELRYQKVNILKLRCCYLFQELKDILENTLKVYHQNLP
jgi:hypothetical protein